MSFDESEVLRVSDSSFGARLKGERDRLGGSRVTVHRNPSARCFRVVSAIRRLSGRADFCVVSSGGAIHALA